MKSPSRISPAVEGFTASPARPGRLNFSENMLPAQSPFRLPAIGDSSGMCGMPISQSFHHEVQS